MPECTARHYLFKFSKLVSEICEETQKEHL